MARPRKGVTFWDRVYSQVSVDGDCLIFTGCKDDCGYGRINRDGKLVRLHREVWSRDNGQIPLGMVIMHKCDKPACIESSHLTLGRQADNIFDMDRKGRRRSLRGVESPKAKLSEDDVNKIRAMIGDGYSCVAAARRFGVTDGMVGHIKHGRAWRHLSQDNGYGT